MQFGQRTVAQVAEAIGRLGWRGKYVAGQVLASPAPDATSFAMLESRPYPDDHFQGMMLYVVSGTGVGQLVYCENSFAGTGVFTITPALSPVLDSTSRVEIWPDQISPADVISNINMALEDVQDRINVYVETPNPTLDSSYQVVTIPDEYVKFCSVKYRDSGGIWRVYRFSHTQDLPWQEQGKDFHIQGRSVYLSEPIPSDITGTDIIISGYRLPARVTSYSDLLECPAGYVTYKATGLLEMALVGLADSDPEGHSQRSSGWLSLAQQLRDGIPYTNYLPTTILLDVDG